MVAAWACIVLFFLILLTFAVMETYVYNIVIYRIVGYFRGEIFANFTNRVQFVKILPLKCLFFSSYYKQSVMIRESFALEKLRKLNS